MAVVLLTEAFVQKTECPPGKKHCEFFDTDLTGFYVDISQTGHKAYRLRYRDNQRYRVVTLAKAHILHCDEARSKARNILNHLALGGRLETFDSPHDSSPEVRYFFEQQYLPYVKSYKRSWQTDESVIRNHIVPTLGNRTLSSLKVPDIARLIESMRNRGYAAGTCNRVLVLLRYGFSLAIKWELPDVRSNPVSALKNLKEDNKMANYLTHQQAQALARAVRDSLNPMLSPIVEFLLLTGARKREVLDARWQEVHLEHKTWKIDKTKSGKARYIPLSEQALALLHQLKLQARSPYVFPNERTGRPFVSVYCSWNRARQQAGLAHIRMHDLRHSFASFLVNAGRSVYEVKELLGHADINTTMRYAHLNRQRLVEAVEMVPPFRHTFCFNY